MPKSLPNIGLHHGEALWVLAQLGFQGTASKSTFYEYIKSLRKLGTPFERGEIGYGRKGMANYSYCHLMELAVTLTLRVYHIVPDSILMEIIRHRASLYRYYRRAYAERCTGIGAAITVEIAGRPPYTYGARSWTSRSIFQGAGWQASVRQDCFLHLMRSEFLRRAMSPHGRFCRSTCPCFLKDLSRRPLTLRAFVGGRKGPASVAAAVRECEDEQDSLDPARPRRRHQASALPRARRPASDPSRHRRGQRRCAAYRLSLAPSQGLHKSVGAMH
jgi:hypothetical protein